MHHTARSPRNPARNPALVAAGVLALVLVLVLPGCRRDGVTSFAREPRFTCDIGRLEDQVAVYNLENTFAGPELAMRDGLFTIADRSGQKVVRYDSYGDLLFMIYNDATNPIPLTLKPLPATADAKATRWATVYPFRAPGKIAVDARHHIYVEDTVPDGAGISDRDHKALLDRTLLHFDADGRFIASLGQGGVSGRPFPPVEGVYASVNDEVAVVCRLPDAWRVYWFNPEGQGLYEVQIAEESLPQPPGATDAAATGLTGSLNAVGIAPDSRRILLKVDYYRDTRDPATNTRTGTEPEGSRIWVLRAEDGVYERSFEAPFYTITERDKNRTVTTNLFYTLLGVIDASWVFLSVPVEQGYALLVLNEAGEEQRRGFIEVRPDELQYNAFSLAPDGILSAMLVGDWNVQILWWRIDQFLR